MINFYGDKNIIQCQRCGKILIAEEYDTHKCTPELKGVKQILIDYYRSQNEDGNIVIVAMGLDGILYRLVVSPPNKTKPSSDGFLQDKKSDEDLTEPGTEMFKKYPSYR